MGIKLEYIEQIKITSTHDTPTLSCNSPEYNSQIIAVEKESGV